MDLSNDYKKILSCIDRRTVIFGKEKKEFHFDVEAGCILSDCSFAISHSSGKVTIINNGMEKTMRDELHCIIDRMIRIDDVSFLALTKDDLISVWSEDKILSKDVTEGSRVNCISVLSDGRLVAGFENGEVMVIRTEKINAFQVSNEDEAVFTEWNEMSNNNVADTYMLPDGTLYNNRNDILYEYPQGNVMNSNRISNQTPVRSFDLCPSRNAVAWISSNGNVYLKDGKRVDPENNVLYRHEAEGKDIKFDPTGRFIISCDNVGVIIFYDLLSENITKRKVNISSTERIIFSESGERFIVIGGEGVASVWKIEPALSDRPEYILITHIPKVIMNFSDSSEKLFVGVRDEICYVYEIKK